jgi:hypothetical protein
VLKSKTVPVKPVTGLGGAGGVGGIGGPVGGVGGADVGPVVRARKLADNSWAGSWYRQLTLNDIRVPVGSPDHVLDSGMTSSSLVVEWDRLKGSV